MSRDLQELVNWAKNVKMTKEELEVQRINWAYGNLKLSRPDLTRREVEEAARMLRGKQPSF